MQYRREIDGLRTVAVIPVLLSHAGVQLFRGGFVGVDVFFVISGYLITNIILIEMDEGRFSFTNFYERRIRRILPALYFVMVASLIAGWFLMSADAYQNLGQSLFATTLFSNNILLTLTSGYWDMESKFKPFLHTWSLGVEEQYYFVIPILLISMHRFAKSHIPSAIFVIGLISFILCLWSYNRYPVANFYLLHTRAWELAVGGWAVTVSNSKRNSDVLSALGLLLIVGTMLLLPEGTATPSPLTLVPVIGSALILLYCRSSGMTYRLLASRPFVTIGLISYSIYLWHQPLFAFLRIASPETPPLWQFLVMIVVSVAMAAISWKYVEKPFRNRMTLSFKTVLLILVPITVLLCAVGLLLHKKGGMPERFDIAPGAEPPGTYAAYNDKVFAEYKRAAFRRVTEHRLLVLGNSQGRDFVNMVNAAHAFQNYEIVYRDDLNLCHLDTFSDEWRRLITDSSLIVLIYDHKRSATCDGRNLAKQPTLRGKLIFVGPKDFGENINPAARLSLPERVGATVRLSPAALDASRYYKSISPPEKYVDVIGNLSDDGLHMPIYDEGGRILSEDRVHVTRAGARYLGKRLFRDPVWRKWTNPKPAGR